MAAKGVNLDALIPRADLAMGEGLQNGAEGDRTLSHAHFHSGPNFFAEALRKPEFQRETTQWSPAKIVDLVAAFLDRRLIPAVILWKSGNYSFVIDGAHRLSALLAWIHDDYGDSEKSKVLFGTPIDPEQQEMANKTRALIEKNIGKYQLFKASLNYPGVVTPKQQERIGNLSVSHFVAQWVPAVSKEAAEESFFIINAAATPLEPTEKKILLSRGAGNSIAARAVAHGGAGYEYWKAFNDETKEKVVEMGKEIFNLLYRPPLAQGTIDTLDVTVAGRGYSTLPFVFDLVNHANEIKMGDSTRASAKNSLLADDTGEDTLKYLAGTLKTVSRITGKRSTSLGLHPVVYFYTAGSAFLPWALLAWAKIVDDLFDKEKVNQFCAVRRDLEEFLIAHKWAMTEIVHKNGSGHRSIPPLVKYWSYVLDQFLAGNSYEDVVTAVQGTEDFAYLNRKDPVVRAPGEGTKRRISRTTMTATIWANALPGAPRCAICEARLHRNSQTGDHITALRDGGDSRPSNAAMTHPYCNSTYKDWKAAYLDG